MTHHGNFLIPEGLEFGELKVEGTAEIDDLEPAYIIAYSGDSYKGGETDVPVAQDGYSYNGIFSSVTFAVANEYGFNLLMASLNLADNSSKILTVFTVPKLAVKSLLPVDPPRNTYLLLGIFNTKFSRNTYNKNITCKK